MFMNARGLASKMEELEALVLEEQIVPTFQLSRNVLETPAKRGALLDTWKSLQISWAPYMLLGWFGLRSCEQASNRLSVIGMIHSKT